MAKLRETTAARRFVRTQSGSGIVGVLIGLALMSIVLVAVTTLTLNNNKNLLTIRLLLTRDSLVNMLKLYSATGDSLTNSLTFPANADLIKCVNGTTPNGCVADTTFDLTVLMPFGPTQISGPPSNPLHYSVDGALCGAADLNCPIEVVTTFTASCPGGTPTCTTAQTVAISYAVKHAAGANPAGGLFLQEKSGTILRKVTDIKKTGLACPTGKCMIGVRYDGSIECEP